jgi:starvation-inducible DNA-binding protein
MAQTAQKTAPDAREAVGDVLNQALAETTVGMMLAQNFHWNVKGMAFGSLHAMFQAVYEDHFAGQDLLAERVRALDLRAEGHLGSMLQRSKVKEHSGAAKAEEMIGLLLVAQETLAATMKEAAEVAEAQDDLLTQDLVIARGQAHEKFAWMLRAHLG